MAKLGPVLLLGQRLRQEIAGIQCGGIESNGGTKLVERLRRPALGSEPASIEETGSVVGRRQCNGSLEMAFGIRVVTKATACDGEVRFEGGIVRCVGRSKLEIMEGIRVVALGHLREAIIHQSASVMGALDGDVVPERFVGMPDIIAAMGANAVSHQHQNGEASHSGMEKFAGTRELPPESCACTGRVCCFGAVGRPQTEPYAPRHAHDEADEWEEHPMIVVDLSERGEGSRQYCQQEPPEPEGDRPPLMATRACDS